MGKESKTANARAKLDTIYNKLDEALGFKEPTRKEIKKQEAKKKYNAMPDTCQICTYRRCMCWIGKKIFDGSHCAVRNIDVTEQKRLEEIAKAMSDNKSEDTGTKNE